MQLDRSLQINENFYALTHHKNYLEFKRLFLEMEETHNYAMNLVVPLMGIAPLLMVFVFKGDQKSKGRKSWTRSTN